ncbi:MAG: transcriptional repressor [Chlorobiaceae bacterium]|nr:transcriptional repressor [Chlorobiaceae bacterium]
MSQSIRTADIESFTRHCREHGMKITLQRVAIYRYLMESGAHPSTDDVFQALRDDFPGLSFDTINRTLMTFYQTGLIDIVESRTGVRRFDANMGSHSHMHCVSCGAMFDIDDPLPDHGCLPQADASGFELLGKNVVFRVICPTCRSSEGRSLRDGSAWK